MDEYVMLYGGWADGLPLPYYKKMEQKMHERRRERVTRCRDCRFFIADALDAGAPGACTEHRHGEVPPGGFCSWGRPSGGVRHRDGDRR